jgi:hypothetical protein
LEYAYLAKTVQRPKYPERRLHPEPLELPKDGGLEEAARFIAETVNDLAWLAGRHRLDLLCYLLSMTQLEAEELVRNHGNKKPS